MFEDPEWLEDEVRALRHWKNNAVLQKLAEEEDNAGIQDKLEEVAEEEEDHFFYLHFIQESDRETRKLMGDIIKN